MIDTIAPGFHEVVAIEAGTEVATYTTPWGDTAAARTAEGATVVVWSDTPVDVAVTAQPITLAADGTGVGTAVVTAGSQRIEVPLVLDGTVDDPGAWWRLANPGGLDAEAHGRPRVARFGERRERLGRADARQRPVARRAPEASDRADDELLARHLGESHESDVEELLEHRTRRVDAVRASAHGGRDRAERHQRTERADLARRPRGWAVENRRLGDGGYPCPRVMAGWLCSWPLLRSPRPRHGPSPRRSSPST